jgi:RecB family exonuclease
VFLTAVPLLHDYQSEPPSLNIQRQFKQTEAEEYINTQKIVAAVDTGNFGSATYLFPLILDIAWSW